MIYNILLFLCVETRHTVPFGLHTLINRPITRVFLKYITPVSKHNDKQK